MNKFRKIFLPFAVMLTVGTASVQAGESISAKIQLNGSTLGLSMSGSQGDSKTTISISGPKGFYRTLNTAEDYQDIELENGNTLADGLYHYEILITSGPYRRVKDTMNNGREENNVALVPTTHVQTGQFTVVNGQIKTYRQQIEPTAAFHSIGR